jgi:hypothetical protein
MAGTMFDRDYPARRRQSATRFTRLAPGHRVCAQPWAGTPVWPRGRIPPARERYAGRLRGRLGQEYLSICERIPTAHRLPEPVTRPAPRHLRSSLRPGWPRRSHRGVGPVAGSCPGAHRDPASGGACRGAGHGSPASADGVISSRGAVSFSEPEWRGFDIRRALEIRLGLPSCITTTRTPRHFMLTTRKCLVLQP